MNAGSIDISCPDLAPYIYNCKSNCLQVGTNIFFREAQLVWDELVPFIDKRAAEAAVQMGLPDSADELLKLVDGNVGKLATLAAALVRVSLSKDKGIEDIAEGVQAGQAGASDAQKDRE